MGSSVDWTWLRKDLASLDRLIETLQTEMQREKGMEKKPEQHSQEFWGNFRW